MRPGLDEPTALLGDTLSLRTCPLFCREGVSKGKNIIEGYSLPALPCFLLKPLKFANDYKLFSSEKLDRRSAWEIVTQERR